MTSPTRRILREVDGYANASSLVTILRKADFWADRWIITIERDEDVEKAMMAILGLEESRRLQAP